MSKKLLINELIKNELLKNEYVKSVEIDIIRFTKEAYEFIRDKIGEYTGKEILCMMNLDVLCSTRQGESLLFSARRSKRVISSYTDYFKPDDKYIDYVSDKQLRFTNLFYQEAKEEIKYKTIEEILESRGINCSILTRKFKAQLTYKIKTYDIEKPKRECNNSDNYSNKYDENFISNNLMFYKHKTQIKMRQIFINEVINLINKYDIVEIFKIFKITTDKIGYTRYYAILDKFKNNKFKYKECDVTDDEILAFLDYEVQCLKDYVEVLRKKVRIRNKFDNAKLIKKFRVGSDLSYNTLCNLIGLNRQYLYKDISQSRLDKDRADIDDFKLIKEIFDTRHDKGARTIKMCLERKGINFNLKKIRRLMKKFDLVCKIRGANKAKQAMKEFLTKSVASNKLKSKFDWDKPRTKLMTDITYLYYAEGRAYLSSIKDLATGQILAYKVSKTIELNFVLDTVKDLVKDNKIFKGAFIHSDQGAHYTSFLYQSLLKKYNLCRSMSARGKCTQNGSQESFHGHLKDEINFRTIETFDDLTLAIDDYMNYYNNDRPQWNLNRLTPNEYETYLKAKSYVIE